MHKIKKFKDYKYENMENTFTDTKYLPKIMNNICIESHEIKYASFKKTKPWSRLTRYSDSVNLHAYF